MSESVMLVLIGGRSAVPAIAGVLQFLDEVDRVKFLLCEGERYLSLQKTVENELKKEKQGLLCDNSDVKSVNPSQFDEVYNAVSELCSNVTELKFVNLTSVPQTMSFSVYNYVRDKYKDSLIYSINTDKSQIFPLVRGQRTIAFNKKLSIDNYVAACGINIFKKKSKYKKSLESIAQYFVEHLDVSREILAVIRSKAGGNESIKVPKGFRISKQEFEKKGIPQNKLDISLKKLEEASIIHNFKNEDQNLYFKITEKEDYEFLAGKWLEIFVYTSAKKSNFDSVEMGVELDDYRGEIDVFCLNNANAVICECKSGKFGSDVLSNLVTKAEKLGGNYCVKLFITSDNEVSEDFRNKAHNNRTVVIAGDRLNQIADILQQEMKNPQYQRR